MDICINIYIYNMCVYLYNLYMYIISTYIYIYIIYRYIVGIFAGSTWITGITVIFGAKDCSVGL